MDVRLPFTRPQQAQSACDPASKPPSPPNSPARSAAGTPFGRRAASQARSLGGAEFEGEPSACTDVEQDSDQDSGSDSDCGSDGGHHAKRTGARQLRGSCGGSCNLLLPSSSASFSVHRCDAGSLGCSESLQHAASGDSALSCPAEIASTDDDQQIPAIQHSRSFSIVAAAQQGEVGTALQRGEQGMAEGSASHWPEVPDDILQSVCAHMPPSYVRVVRLVCRGWAAAAGRLMQRLKPEALEGPRLAQRFPHLRALDLSHCLHTVTFHTQCAPLHCD